VFYAKYGKAGLYTDKNRSTPATAASFVCTFETGYRLADPAFTEANQTTAADFAALLAKTYTDSKTYTINVCQIYTLTMDKTLLAVVSGATVSGDSYYLTENTDLVLSFVSQPGKLLVGVSATVNNNTSVPAVHNADGTYTIAGASITDDLTVTADVIDGSISFIDPKNYYDDTNAGNQIVKVTVSAQFDGSHLSLGSYDLTWSAKYLAYIGFVSSDATAQSVADALVRASGTGNAVAYDGDVNRDGKVNVLDALAINAKLNDINWISGFQEANLLEMDVNGDGVVNVTDIQIVLKKSVGLL